MEMLLILNTAAMFVMKAVGPVQARKLDFLDDDNVDGNDKIWFELYHFFSQISLVLPFLFAMAMLLRQ